MLHHLIKLWNINYYVLGKHIVKHADSIELIKHSKNIKTKWKPMYCLHVCERDVFFLQRIKKSLAMIHDGLFPLSRFRFVPRLLSLMPKS